jgi:uncharacterized SAM-binding protein YcdF (DUF218 family)
MTKASWFRRRLLLLCALLFVFCCGFVLMFPSIWPWLLSVEIPMARADAIVVLGGEAEGRPREAARLHRAGVAPLVFVVGVGDAERGRQVLLSEGVPASRIVIEPRSCSTVQNAEFSGPLLEAAGVKRALLVTSRFHTRRALGTFRKQLPGIEFGVVGAKFSWWETPEGKKSENRFAMVEAGKTLGYWLVHGVRPF